MFAKHIATASRAELEQRHGAVWNAEQAAEDFRIIDHRGSFVRCRRNSDNAEGLLRFQQTPRFYFSFEPYHKR
jgi:hypothetical protein